MPKIYTKTGDKGTTSLYNGERVSKSASYCEVVGNLDEISSSIGCVYTELEFKTQNSHQELTEEVLKDLQWIQSRLLDLGSHVATPVNSSSSTDKKLQQTVFPASNYVELETRIDYYETKLPPLKNFILPYGSTHMCRSITRRCERSMINLLELQTISLDSFIFINRLSDFFFVLGRHISSNIYLQEEIIYKKVKN
jgi:cob(I)alamin adenosyltransferase